MGIYFGDRIYGVRVLYLNTDNIEVQDELTVDDLGTDDLEAIIPRIREMFHIPPENQVIITEVQRDISTTYDKNCSSYLVWTSFTMKKPCQK